MNNDKVISEGMVVLVAKKPPLCPLGPDHHTDFHLALHSCSHPINI